MLQQSNVIYKEVIEINQQRLSVTGDAPSSEGRAERPCVIYLCVYGAIGTDFMESNCRMITLKN